MTDDTPPAEEIDDEANETDAGESGKTPRRVLSDAEFAVIREIYELGSKGIVELSLEFNVSRQTLHKRFVAAGIKRGSRAHEISKAVQTGVLQASQAAGAAAAAQEPAERFSDKRADWIEETRITGYKSLKQAEMLARKTIADAIKAGTALSAQDDNLKTVQRLN
ncbi:MAG: hypothetical protein EOR96_34500, partial [Mesorhizobium sp.]